MGGRADTGDAVLAFVGEFIRKKGYAPSYREIMAGVGISSTSHISYWIKKLVGEGLLLQGGKGQSRTVRLP